MNQKHKVHTMSKFNNNSSNQTSSSSCMISFLTPSYDYASYAIINDHHNNKKKQISASTAQETSLLYCNNIIRMIPIKNDDSFTSSSSSLAISTTTTTKRGGDGLAMSSHTTEEEDSKENRMLLTPKIIQWERTLGQLWMNGEFPQKILDAAFVRLTNSPYQFIKSPNGVPKVIYRFGTNDLNDPNLLDLLYTTTDMLRTMLVHVRHKSYIKTNKDNLVHDIMSKEANLRKLYQDAVFDGLLSIEDQKTFIKELNEELEPCGAKVHTPKSHLTISIKPSPYVDPLLWLSQTHEKYEQTCMALGFAEERLKDIIMAKSLDLDLFIEEDQFDSYEITSIHGKYGGKIWK